jgi:hypothetical protein
MAKQELLYFYRAKYGILSKGYWLACYAYTG